MTQDARVEAFVTAFEALRAEVEKVIVGHREIITHVLTAMFAGGHVLLEGVPGLGKTLLIKTLAEGLELSFSRIDRKSTRLNSSHRCISYAVFCLKKKKRSLARRAPPTQMTRALLAN